MWQVYQFLIEIKMQTAGLVDTISGGVYYAQFWLGLWEKDNYVVASGDSLA